MSAQVLITGATGHVGIGVLIRALEDGYSVRAAVRSLSSTDKILSLPAIKEKHLADRLSFIEVPDILAAGAYDEAIKDVQYVIHIASPIPQPHLANANLTETVVNPAVQGTLNILEAGLKNAALKRIVVTSSVVANLDLSDPTASADPNSREAVPEYNNLSEAYRASKHAALLASDEFMVKNQPHFDLINIMPSYVIGRKELASSASEVLTGSNGIALGLLINGPQPSSTPGSTVHLDDVVHVHVNALQLVGKENRSFGVSTDFDPNAVFDIVQERFPEAVANGTFKKPTAVQPFHFIKWDASETEKTFGIKFKGVEEQVTAVVKQLLELQGSA